MGKEKEKKTYWSLELFLIATEWLCIRKHDQRGRLAFSLGSAWKYLENQVHDV